MYYAYADTSLLIIHAAINDKRVVVADRKGPIPRNQLQSPFLAAFSHITIEAREHHDALKICDYNITKSYQFMKGQDFLKEDLL